LLYTYYDRRGDPRYLHPFPTRRSSDLAPTGRKTRAATPGAITATGSGSGIISTCSTSSACPAHTTSTRRCSKPVPRSSSASTARSEEHTSELQSRENLVCRLLLEKKNT